MAGGGAALSKNRGRGGGVSEEEEREGEGRRGNVCGEGGGLNIFFRGRNAHPEDLVQNQMHSHPVAKGVRQRSLAKK